MIKIRVQNKYKLRMYIHEYGWYINIQSENQHYMKQKLTWIIKPMNMNS